MVLGTVMSGAKRAARPVLRRSRAARRAAAAARLARAARILHGPGLVDPQWYALQAGRPFTSADAAVRHYVETGRWLGLSPHPLYEPQRLPAQDRKRLRNGYVPYAAFLRRAKSPKARPHPLFEPRRYLEQNPKARRHRFGAWGHFLQNAADGTPLPLPPTIASVPTDGVTLTYGAYLGTARRTIGLWAAQTAIADPPRVTRDHDEDADRAVRAEAAAYPLPDGADGPLVSVITAVRNRPNQVLEAIASVTRQTLTSWELIVVDDGSDDTTPDAVAELARHDDRIRLLRRARSGVSAARNAGAEQARGRYVAWLDSDNTWAPDFLEVMVRFLEGRGLRAAYASCAMVTEDGIVHRDFAGGLEHLAVGNFVDLNVLVVRRDLLTEVGGFDPDLPRAVDYDLVYKIAKQTDLGYVPILAATYSDDNTDTRRISIRELKTWNYVVRERHVLDWDAVARAVPQRVPGRVSVLLSGREEWRLTWGSVLSVLHAAEPGTDVEVVVVDSASSRTPSVLIGALAAVDPRVRVVRTVTNYNNAGGRNVALAHSTGELAVVLANGATATPGWLGPLRTAFEDPGVVAAAPLVVAADGLVRTAGMLLPPAAGLPVPFLAGHPLRDLAALPERLEVPALAVGAVAARAADLVAVKGFDPLYIDALDDVDLSLRLRRERGGRCVVLTGARVVQLVWPEQPADEIPVQNRRLFAARWRDRAGQGDGLWERAGFVLAGYRPAPPTNVPDEPDFPHDVVDLEPMLMLPAVLPDGTARRPRWAVEIPDMPTTGFQFDDVAAALAEELERRGVTAVVRRAAARNRTPLYLDDVVVTFRGVKPTAPVSGRYGVLVTSRPGREPVSGEAARFDAVVDAGDLDDVAGLADQLLPVPAPADLAGT